MLRHSTGRIGRAHQSGNAGAHGSAKRAWDVGLRCANPACPIHVPPEPSREWRTCDPPGEESTDCSRTSGAARVERGAMK